MEKNYHLYEHGKNSGPPAYIQWLMNLPNKEQVLQELASAYQTRVRINNLDGPVDVTYTLDTDGTLGARITEVHDLTTIKEMDEVFDAAIWGHMYSAKILKYFSSCDPSHLAPGGDAIKMFKEYCACYAGNLRYLRSGATLREAGSVSQKDIGKITKILGGEAAINVIYDHFCTALRRKVEEVQKEEAANDAILDSTADEFIPVMTPEATERYYQGVPPVWANDSQQIITESIADELKWDKGKVQLLLKVLTPDLLSGVKKIREAGNGYRLTAARQKSEVSAIMKESKIDKNERKYLHAVFVDPDLLLAVYKVQAYNMNREQIKELTKRIHALTKAGIWNQKK